MMPMRTGPRIAITIFILSVLVAVAIWLPAIPSPVPHAESGKYSNSLVVAPHYVEYLSDSDERFAHQAAELKRRLGAAPHVLVGFAAALPMQFPAMELEHVLSKDQMARTLQDIDRIVERAETNHVIVHITLTSGFFHGMNELRPAAIRQDVRNAQWFADGWIGEPASFAGAAAAADGGVVPPDVWVTPSRYAKALRARMEEGVRIVGSHLADKLVTESKS